MPLKPQPEGSKAKQLVDRVLPLPRELQAILKAMLSDFPHENPPLKYTRLYEVSTFRRLSFPFLGSLSHETVFREH